ncbi:TPA: hypothetical protein SIC62_000176 [Pasteurella multocida]|nr:DUF6521 family protein [Pasteurella multocida]HDR1919915.1 hypothetical protein [Pasteurella multocida]HEA3244331.1 hypothetical protein [Pasteurella multocida]HED4428469.1 hypothetical protein [Pasteurella multocida]HEH9648566.1 hypothetical protein [Pasteurella multocida]
MGLLKMNTINALYFIKYNPFKYAKYIYSFYKSSEPYNNNLLLSPLIIPLCTHPTYSKKKITSRSTLYTIFQDKKELYDLQERVNYFRELTSESIQFCLANDWLYFDSEKLSLYTNEVDIEIEPFPKKLGDLLKDYSVGEIYFNLGVK